MAEILEQLNNLKELGYIQKAHLNVLEVALEDYKTEIRAKAIDDYMNALCNKCLDMKNECYQLECPFCDDGCNIVNIAEQLKGGATDESTGSD